MKPSELLILIRKTAPYLLKAIAKGVGEDLPMDQIEPVYAALDEAIAEAIADEERENG